MPCPMEKEDPAYTIYTLITNEKKKKKKIERELASSEQWQNA